MLVYYYERTKQTHVKCSKNHKNLISCVYNDYVLYKIKIDRNIILCDRVLKKINSIG